MGRGKKKLLLALELMLLALLVPSPALRFGGGIVTPYSLCVALSVLLAVVLFNRLRLRKIVRPKDGPIGVIFRVDALDLALCAIPAALLGARALYVLMRPGYYLAAPLSAFYLWEGGFLLYGAALGAMIAAALLAKKRKSSIPVLFDHMAAPGLLMIAICRLGEWFVGEGLGPWIENPAWMRFPFAVQNPYGEWQLAVFLFEACFAALTTAYVLHTKAGEGCRFLRALVLYASSQIVFESLRMDSCLRIGFVRVSQVISALVLVMLTAFIQKKASGRKAALGRCLLTIGCIALIGGIEWALDKTQVGNGLLYIAMTALCVLMAANALGIRKEGNKGMNNRETRNAMASLIASMVVFGTIGIFRRYIDLPSSVIAMMRGFIGTAFLLIFILVRGKKIDRQAIQKNLIKLVISGAIMGFNWILLFEAYRYTSVATATLCYYMAPILMMLASPVLLNERLTKKKIICMLAALIGMIPVSGVLEAGFQAGEMRGVLLGLGAAALYATVVLINKTVRDIGAYDKTIVQLLTAAVALAPYVLATENLSAITLTGASLAMMLFVGVVHTGAAYALYFGCTHLLSAQTLAIVSYVDPVVAILLSALLLGERMTLLGAAGAVLVLGATLISELPDRKRS